MARTRRDRPAQLVMQWVNLLLALVVLSIGLVVVVAAPAEAEQFATLHPLEGAVEVSEDGEPFRDGREGQVLAAGDTVRTGPDGRAEIEYFDESVTRLETDTTFSLQELSTNTDVPGSKTIVAEQEEGRTFERVVAITDSESRFDVETPTATASVRGTTYVLNRLPDGTVVLWVLPDDDPDEVGEVVLILDDGTEIVVREGQGVTVFPDGTAGEPFTLTEEQLTDAWVLYNLCQLDALPVEACETDEPEDPFDPIDPLDPEEPEEPEDEGEPTPSPPAPPSFVSGGTTTAPTGEGDGGGGGGPEDTTPPRTTITEAPDDPTRSRSATFRFRANEPVRFFECSLDGGSFNRCNSGRTYTGLSDGTHLFRVRATDKAGNRESTPSHRWTIDNQPPDTIIDSGPGGDCFEDEGGTVCPDGDATFTFHATEEGSTFECRLEEEEPVDRGAAGTAQPHDWQPCSSPRSYSGLEDYTGYTFSVRATDPAGNTDPSPPEASWFVCSECGGPGRERGNGSAEGQGAGPAAVGAEVGSSSGGIVEDSVSTVQGVVQVVDEIAENVTTTASDLQDTVSNILPLSDATGSPTNGLP